MPTDTLIERRDRALLAMTALTGIRERAMVTLQIRHFDRQQMLVHQDPRQVKTKFGKQIHTFLFPFGIELEQIVLAWIDELVGLGFNRDAPLFPNTELTRENGIYGRKLVPKHWADAQMVRRIFAKVFKRAGHEAYTPHSFRKMIVAELYERDVTPEELKAWSQNLGHSGVLTTLTSYGKIHTQRQGFLIRTGKASATGAVDFGNMTREQKKAAIEQLLKEI